MKVLTLLLFSVVLLAACASTANVSSVDDKLKNIKPRGDAAMINDIVGDQSDSEKQQKDRDIVLGEEIASEEIPSPTVTPHTTPKTLKTVSELQVKDVMIGAGKEASAGAVVAVHYTGKLTDGSLFDSSVVRKQPFIFRLGSGEVIKGWDMGIVGMKVGGKRTLIIPAHLAYGDSSPSPTIPAGATLVFEVELLQVN